MKPILLLLVMKVVTLLASIVSTIGLVSFFFFEALHPYRWHLLIGGLVAIMVTEVMSHLITKRLGTGITLEDR